MNKTIYLIRHGKIHNPDDIVYGSGIVMHLTDEGRAQLKSLAIKIHEKGEVPEKIISSPLERAVDSAMILAKEWSISGIEEEPDLKDSCVPAVEGKKMSFLKDLYKKNTDEYSEEFVKLGNESREDIGRRMMEVFKNAVAQSPTTALVSHGDPIFFLMFKLENPGTQIPLMTRADIDEIPGYLPKGHAWKLNIDEYGSILSKEFITPKD